MESLVEEIKGLQKRGITITPKNLLISENVSIVLPYHKLIDKAKEAKKKGDKKIGTTGRGIGPAYTDKYVRIGGPWSRIHFWQWSHPDILFQS